MLGIPIRMVSNESDSPPKPHAPNVNYFRPTASHCGVALAIFALGSALAMSTSSCLCNFSLRWVANANVVSGGIQALHS